MVVALVLLLLLLLTGPGVLVMLLDEGPVVEAVLDVAESVTEALELLEEPSGEEEAVTIEYGVSGMVDGPEDGRGWHLLALTLLASVINATHRATNVVPSSLILPWTIPMLSLSWWKQKKPSPGASGFNSRYIFFPGRHVQPW